MTLNDQYALCCRKDRKDAFWSLYHDKDIPTHIVSAKIYTNDPIVSYKYKVYADIFGG